MANKKAPTQRTHRKGKVELLPIGTSKEPSLHSFRVGGRELFREEFDIRGGSFYVDDGLSLKEIKPLLDFDLADFPNNFSLCIFNKGGSLYDTLNSFEIEKKKNQLTTAIGLFSDLEITNINPIVAMNHFMKLAVKAGYKEPWDWEAYDQNMCTSIQLPTPVRGNAYAHFMKHHSKLSKMLNAGFEKVLKEIVKNGLKVKRKPTGK